MEKPVHSRPVSEEDEALSSTKKPRLEASPGFEDIEKYTIFIDSEYKLPLYLSEFALSVFNSEKKASYEKVKVVKTMKSLDVVKGTTYLVTFEASLPKFSEEIKQYSIDVKKSDVSESKEEGSEEDISESDEEDSEEGFSEESDEEDKEEMPSKSDEKDTVTNKKFGGINIVPRKTVGGKGPRIQLAYYGRWTYYDPRNENLSTAALNDLVYLSQQAICVYNMKEVTYYDNVKVLKAMQSLCSGRTYHITFEASLSDVNAITFQTEVLVLDLKFSPHHKSEIEYVKPGTTSNDIAK